MDNADSFGCCDQCSVIDKSVSVVCITHQVMIVESFSRFLVGTSWIMDRQSVDAYNVV